MTRFCVPLSFFSPFSPLTLFASDPSPFVFQTTARRNEWPLDKTMNTTEVTRFIEAASVTAHNKEVRLPADQQKHDDIALEYSCMK